MSKIRIGIVGYGNLGRGVEAAIGQQKDMSLEAIFTRRDPASLNVSGVVVDSIDNIENYVSKIDVMILCGGSAKDLPVQSPAVLENFCIVDSFDTHAKIPAHFARLDEVGKRTGNLGLLSSGWDPGIFSMMRILFESIAPDGETYTFWGKGVSQGHSDAIRQIEGVKNAVQYTIPREDALEAVRSGVRPDLSTKDKHLRECFVALEEGADADDIIRQIKTMPNYFADYETIVHIVTEEYLAQEHNELPHGGIVTRTANSAKYNNFMMEFNLKLDSNPEFTGSVLGAYARAVYRMNEEGKTGAITVFDVPLSAINPASPEEQRERML